VDVPDSGDKQRRIKADAILRRVQSYMAEHGLSGIEFCERAGRTRAMLTSMKAAAENDGTITIETVADAAHAMNTTVGYLIGETDDPRPGFAPFALMDQLFEAAAKLWDVGKHTSGTSFARDLTRVCDWIAEDPESNKIGQLTPSILRLIINNK
jgi:transcriptional regulator with XRE-family HTH domain